MARWLFVAALIVGAFASNNANAARTLLADLMARAPAEANAPTMSPLALEACLRRARELDAVGIAIDYEIAAIDREAAEALMLQKQLNAELPRIGDYDEPSLNEFHRRAIRHEELAKKFHAEFPLYQKKQKDYDEAVVELEHNCASRFKRGDLETVKKLLDIK